MRHAERIGYRRGMRGGEFAPAPDPTYPHLLAEKAAQLGAGQSIKLTTINLAGPDGAAWFPGEAEQFLHWSNTCGWGVDRQRVSFCGKRNGSFPYHRLEYIAATNTWTNTESVHPSMTTPQSGHGYDHNAVHPVTGDIYFRRFNNAGIHKWDRALDSWSTLPNMPTPFAIAEAIEWWDGRGLVYSDVNGVKLFNGTSWSVIVPGSSVSGIGWHSFGEYQPNADYYVFGGGNDGPTKLYRVDRDDTLTLLGPAPIGLGNAEVGQGILVYDPTSERYIAWNQNGLWYEFDALADVWTPITKSTGTGDTAQTGAPNFSEEDSVACPIPEYDCIMFFGPNSDDVWLYRHTVSHGGALVQEISLTSTTANAVKPFTLGAGFAEGDSTAPTLNVESYQVEVKKRWPDNSVKHAIFSGRAYMASNVPRPLRVYAEGTAPTGTDLTIIDILNAAPSASVQCGAIGTVSLGPLLGSPQRTVHQGPEMIETHYRQNVGTDPTLGVWFYVRLYADNSIFVRAIVDNGFLDVATADKTYVPTVIIGGVTVYDNGGAALTHYAQTRWMAEGWIGITDPDVSIAHDTAYLQASKLVPNYGWSPPSATALNALQQTYTPMDRAGWQQDMGDTGYQNQIGLIPHWDAMYLTSGGDSRAFNAMVTAAKAINSYPILWRDSNTKDTIILSDWATWTVNGAGGGGATSRSAGLLTWDVAHHGSAGYLAYLLTGDFTYLDSMKDQCAMVYLVTDSARGSGTSRIIQPVQTRGVAWAHRTIGQLAGIGPTGTAGHELITNDFVAMLDNDAVYWDTKRQQIGQNLLGYLHVYWSYAIGNTAPWQQHFWIASQGHVSDLKPLPSMVSFDAVRDNLYKAIVGILGPNGTDSYCFTKASAYNVKVSDANDDSTNWYDSWGTVFLETHGVPNTACANTLEGTSGGDPANASTGYWGNLLPAIAYALDHGATGAGPAWGRLTGATNWNVVANSGFEDQPVWGIVSRT